MHYLKTPLSVLQLINQENEDNPLALEIQRETDKILQGLNMALYYVRSENIINDLHFEKAKLESLVREVVFELKRWFIRSHIFPKVQIDSDYEIVTDKKWLKFIVYQLLTNSIKYSDKEDALISVILENDCLVIKDNGMGIPLKDQTRVFDQFYTGNNGRIKGESTGIGLYLVKQVCDQLKYPLSLKSKQGEWTHVSIDLRNRLS